MKDDTISRAAAIETVRKAQSIGQAHRMLIQLPSAQPGWIPVTERLPTENNSYLVWMPFAPEGHHITVAEWCGSYWNIKTPITAWMPLPAPYIPEGDDKHEG